MTAPAWLALNSYSETVLMQQSDSDFTVSIHRLLNLQRAINSAYSRTQHTVIAM